MFEIGDHVIIPHPMRISGKSTGTITNIKAFGKISDENCENVLIEIDNGIPIPYRYVDLDPEFEPKRKILIRNYQRLCGTLKLYHACCDNFEDRRVGKFFETKRRELIKEFSELEGISVQEAERILNIDEVELFSNVPAIRLFEHQMR